MKIIVKGTATLRGNFEVELEMSEEEFDGLPRENQDEEIENAIDWRDWLDSSDTSDIDIDEVKEVIE